MNLELGRHASWTRAGLDTNGLRLEMRAADHRTGAVAVGIASSSDANGKLCCLERELSWIKMELSSSRIRNVLGLELIRWIRAGTDAGRIKVRRVRIRVPKQIGAHCICA
ncbi:hypothetical protein F2Q68_00029839 [Brassica cretica]|uniref:Uncharacterized protein n=1 Tax=Brassica cretica TaxID=69181 RepID=A0A8S9GD09_BRACR|nr:hypothetical protein F2Q68_00029839 [Brassica cretica]